MLDAHQAQIGWGLTLRAGRLVRRGDVGVGLGVLEALIIAPSAPSLPLLPSPFALTLALLLAFGSARLGVSNMGGLKGCGNVDLRIVLPNAPRVAAAVIAHWGMLAPLMQAITPRCVCPSVNVPSLHSVPVVRTTQKRPSHIGTNNNNTTAATITISENHFHIPNTSQIKAKRMANLPSQHPNLSLHLTDRALTPLITSARASQHLSHLTSLVHTAQAAYESAQRLGLGPVQRIMVEHGDGPVLLQTFLSPIPPPSRSTTPPTNGSGRHSPSPPPPPQHQGALALAVENRNNTATPPPQPTTTGTTTTTTATTTTTNPTVANPRGGAADEPGRASYLA
ncbi:hypothetical protein CHU98_g11555, partial [Xylaria longipes]